MEILQALSLIMDQPNNEPNAADYIIMFNFTYEHTI
jgi:hypothetical protein